MTDEPEERMLRLTKVDWESMEKVLKKVYFHDFIPSWSSLSPVPEHTDAEYDELLGKAETEIDRLRCIAMRYVGESTWNRDWLKKEAP